MAKASKPADTQEKIVPPAELVGDHAANHSTAIVTQPAIKNDATGASQDEAAQLRAAMQVISDQSAQYSGTILQQKFAEHGAGPNADQLLDLAEDHDFPLLEQAYEAFMNEHGHSDIKAIRITEKGDGLRRGGMRHVGKVDHPVNAFTGEQIEQLLAEPLLTVEFIVAED